MPEEPNIKESRAGRIYASSSAAEVKK